jgi:hypothetical protein
VDPLRIGHGVSRLVLLRRSHLGGGVVAAPASHTLPTGNLLHRYRADSVTGVADGAAVASLPALVGGIALTQATGTSQPLYVASSAMGGKPALRWPTVQSTDYLTASGFTTHAQPVTVTVVLSPADTAGTEGIFYAGSNMGILINGNKTYAAYGGTTNLVGATNSQLTGPTVVTVTFNGASSTIHVNGTLTASGTSPGTSSSGGIWYLGRTNAGSPFRGDIAELIFNNTALDATGRANVHAYVQDWYGITVSDYGLAA